MVNRNDLDDVDFVDAVELASDGTTSVFSGETVVSTTAGNRHVVLAGVDLFRDEDRLQSGDRIVLAGTTGGADGTYTVGSIFSIDTFIVVEVIATSTGGTADAYHPVGASLVGFDPTNTDQIISNEVQGAIEEVANDRGFRRHFLLMGG